MAFANWMNKLRAKEKVKSPKKATNNGKEVLKPPTSEEAPSSATKQNAAAAKEYIENHYKKQMKNLQERQERYDFYCLMVLVLISNNEEQDVTVKSRGGSQMQKTRLANMLDNSVYFNHGWGEFVQKNFLKENDILIFNYNGDYHFVVLMFDGENFCEKECPYFVLNQSSSKSPCEVVTSSRGILGNLAEKSTDNHMDIHTIPVAQLATHPAYKRIRLGSSYASPTPSSFADYLYVMYTPWFFYLCSY
ncbi:hypothetical protein ACFE04_011199 [Oxalis oulophora]